MKIIHLEGYTREECQAYKDIIHSNVIMAMRSIVNAGERLGVDGILPENKPKADLFTTNEILFEQKVTPEIAEAVKALWKDPGIQAIYERANEFQLIDSAALYVTATYVLCACSLGACVVLLTPWQLLREH